MSKATNKIAMSPFPIVGADDNSGGDWGTPDTWAGGEPLSPEWEGFNAGVGTFFAGLDQTFLGGGVADGMQVWSNTAGQDMGSAQRIYVSAGTGVATFFGVHQLSDAGAEHDAVNAHSQSTGERVSKAARVGSTCRDGLWDQGGACGLGVPGASSSIATPYGPAIQEESAAALQVRGQIQQGATVYKGGVLGRSDTGASQFFATENPLKSRLRRSLRRPTAEFQF